MSKLLEAVANAMIPVPEWATKGYFDSDPSGLRALKARWQFPVTSADERRWSIAHNANRAAIVARGDVLFELGFPCTGCGRFSFPTSRRCFWCAR